MHNNHNFGVFNIPFKPLFFRVILFLLLDLIMLSITNVKVTGTLSVRLVLSIVFIFIALFKRHFIIDNVIKCFFVYLFLYILANFFNGELFTNGEHVHILSNQFIAIALILFLPSIYKSEINFRAAIIALLIMLLTTFFISHLQFIKNKIGWAIGLFLSSEEKGEAAEFILDSDGEFVGTALIPGIFNSAVTNGYFIATFLPLTMTLSLFFKRRFGEMITANILFVVAVVVSYYLQQRAWMLLVVMFIIYYYFDIKTRFHGGLLVGFFIFFLLVLFLPDFLSGIEMGRFSEAGDTRTRLLISFLDYSKTGNLLWGGVGVYRKLYSDPQHNALLSAWVLGGLFCFLVITFLTIILLIKLGRFRNNFDPILKSSSICCIFYVFSSMLHSAGIQNNAVMFWIVYMLFLSRKKYLRFQLQRIKRG